LKENGQEMKEKNQIEFLHAGVLEQSLCNPFSPQTSVENWKKMQWTSSNESVISGPGPPYSSPSEAFYYSSYDSKSPRARGMSTTMLLQHPRSRSPTQLAFPGFTQCEMDASSAGILLTRGRLSTSEKKKSSGDINTVRMFAPSPYRSQINN
jgi:hypothetical protein